jgi:aryl-alcohol dehydrogenase-like predicted oxidoreductase
MRYTRLGNTGLIVSRLSFGAMTFGSYHSISAIFKVDKDAGFGVVEKMREIAARHEAGVAQIAIAWLLAKPVVSSVIVGASKPHQLEDDLKAADLKLSEAEVAELDAITAPTPLYPNWFNANLIDTKHKTAIEGV